MDLPYFEWGAPEYRRLIAAFMKPTAVGSLEKMRGSFVAILDNRPVYPFNMARSALATALKMFQQARPDATQLIVPAYICPSVIDTVQMAGLSIVPADIGPDLNLDPDGLEELFSANTLAVLAAHMYGCPARIREIEAICRRRGVFLIDDSAQVTGVSSDGRQLGTFGDLGLISFSQSKTIVTGCHNAGGLLIVNNPKFERGTNAAYAELPAGRASIADFATFFWNYVWASWTEMPSYYYARVFHPGSKSQIAAFATASKMNNVVAALALEQLNSLQRRMAGRLRVADFYNQKVSSQRAIGFPQFAPARYLTRVVMTAPESVDPAEIRKDLRQKGIRTRGGYPVYTSERCALPQKALAMQPRLIELPSHSGMTADTVDKVWNVFHGLVTSFDTARPWKSARHRAIGPDDG